MGTSAQIVLTSGIFSLIFVILFTIETRRGMRFGEQLRAVLDRLILRIEKSVREYVPEINSLFLQELFFYTLHLSLSRVLSLVRSIERVMLRVVRFNRLQAQKLRAHGREANSLLPSETSPTTDPHLTLIAEHKKSTELTHKEKKKRKEASIESSGPLHTGG